VDRTQSKIVENACVRIEHAIACEAVAAGRTAEGRRVIGSALEWAEATDSRRIERFELLVIAVWEALPNAHRAYARDAANALCIAVREALEQA
jgi:hypothetical protein